MEDQIEFRIFDPKGKEIWVDDFYSETDIRLVAIYLNGREIVDILKEIELAYDTETPGSYGHLTPKNLYRNLSDALIPGTYSHDHETFFLCCESCGIDGCWSVVATVTQDENYVYWTDFRQPHRPEWKYPISYRFRRMQYEKEMNKLNAYQSAHPNDF